MPLRRARILADATLVYTLGVILWGAFVRATGSGAGCGSHWPMCNGEVVPRAPSVETLIELTHRVTSGLSLVAVVLTFFAVRRALPAGHLARRASGWSVALMVVEAALGAGLVLFEKVAGDTSHTRAVWMGAHLINTTLLIGAMGLVSWAVRRDAPVLERSHRASLLLFSALGAMLAVGVTGAIAALGDTLFPARSLAEGLTQDLDPSSHLFVQLRFIHPFVACAGALHLLIVAATFARSTDPSIRRFAMQVGLGAATQVSIGIINLVLAAPVAMQLLHLLAADVLWLSLVGLTASVLATPAAQPSSRQTSHAQAATSTITTNT